MMCGTALEGVTRTGLRSAAWIVWWIFTVFGARAAVVTNYLYDLTYYFWPTYSLSVNTGDTVVWVNNLPEYLGSNYVESYGGEWKSPVLGPGGSFSFTFTRPGFYAYRTGIPISGANASGTVTVSAWTGAPPAITINSPVDGTFIGGLNLVQASAANAANLAEVQYFANSALVGTATNAPYAVWWLPPQGRYELAPKPSTGGEARSGRHR